LDRSIFWTVFCVLVFSLSFLDGLSAQETPDENDSWPLPTAEEIMGHMDTLYRATSSHSMMQMQVVTEHWSRTLEIEGWSRGEDEALMIIRSPAREAGTATLRNPEGLWNYAPRADRLMRIPSGMLSESWMGSHLTNDDLMRQSEYDDDYETVLSRSDCQGEPCILAVMTPHPDAPVVYSEVTMAFTREQWIPLFSEYFDGSDRVRRWEFSNVQAIGGRDIPMSMILIPDENPEERTQLTYTVLEFDIEMDEGLFTQRGLRRAAQSR
jgi:outer membrane lipoprotein-sorting protein